MLGQVTAQVTLLLRTHQGRIPASSSTTACMARQRPWCLHDLLFLGSTSSSESMLFVTAGFAGRVLESACLEVCGHGIHLGCMQGTYTFSDGRGCLRLTVCIPSLCCQDTTPCWGSRSLEEIQYTAFMWIPEVSTSEAGKTAKCRGPTYPLSRSPQSQTACGDSRIYRGQAMAP